jgi:hypothetical protein
VVGSSERQKFLIQFSAQVHGPCIHLQSFYSFAFSSLQLAFSVQFLACALYTSWSCKVPCPGAQSKVEGFRAMSTFALDQFMTQQMEALEEMAFKLVNSHRVATSSALTCVILYFATSVTHHLPAGRCSGILQAVFGHRAASDRQAESASPAGRESGWLEDEFPDTLILVRPICSFAYCGGMKKMHVAMHWHTNILCLL